jgi:cytochrome c-type biogenesis protein CcmH
LGVIGVTAFIALRLFGLSRGFAGLALGALVLGGVGYAVQQRADLPGKPVSAQARAIDVDPGLVAFRAMIMPGTAADRAILRAADTQMRRGDTTAAVRGLVGAVRAAPRNATLWTGLGGALSAHDSGQMSPAAQFAFRRAVQLAPREPGPPFFLGMALIQSGDLPAAKTAWLRALALAPRDAPYRVDIAERLVMVDQFQAMMDAAQAQQQRQP